MVHSSRTFSVLLLCLLLLVFHLSANLDPAFSTARHESQGPALGRRTIAATGACLLQLHPWAAVAETDGVAKRALVTGANSGIGLATAMELAMKGWQVVPLCRSDSKLRDTVEDITDLVPDAKLDTSAPPCELADLRSVGAVVKALASGPKFDALVFDAGIDGAPFQKTPQGQEMHFAVNHLGHFALYTGLKGAKVADAHRVVTVTSSAALDSQLDLSDLNWEKRTYGRHDAYADSKACNVLFTDELARRLRASGIVGGAANCIDPGPTATQICRYAYPERALQRKDMTPMQLEKQARMFGLKTPQQAAQGVVWLADSGEVTQVADGQWWTGPRSIFAAGELAWRNEKVAKELWEKSEELVKPFVL